MTIRYIGLVGSSTFDGSVATALSDGGYLLTTQTDGAASVTFLAADGEQRADVLTFSGSHLSTTVLASGRILAVWETSHYDEASGSVLLSRNWQMLDPDGTTVGEAGSTPAAQQGWYSVTALADGGWVLNSFNYDMLPETPDVHQQAFFADGSVRAEAFVQTAQNFQILALDDGAWVSSWEIKTSGIERDLRQQVFAADGTVRSEADTINVTTAGDQFEQILTGLDDGGWVVTWSSRANGHFYDQTVYQRVFNADGTARSGEIALGVPDGASVMSVKTIARDGGGWLTIVNQQDANRRTVVERIFDSAGQEVGAAQELTAPGRGRAQIEDITFLAHGGWVANWSIGQSPGTIFQQAFDEDGAPIAEPRRLEQFNGHAIQTETVALDDGGWVTAWVNQEVDRSSASYTDTLNMRVFSADGRAGQTISEIDHVNGWYDYFKGLVINKLTAHEGSWALSWSSVGDSSGTTHSGIFDLGAETPSGTSLRVQTPEDAVYHFGTQDFGFSDYGPDPDAIDAFRSVIVTSLPYWGKLRINGDAVKAGQEIAIADIPQLSWRPAKDFYGNVDFAFQVTDDGGEDGRSFIDPTPNHFTLEVLNVPERLTGTNKSESLVGTYDDDLIIGRKGDDALVGGSGRDIFKFSTGDGHDKIKDFELYDQSRYPNLISIDRIDLSAMDAIRNEQDLMRHHLTETKNGFIIHTFGDSIEVHVQKTEIDGFLIDTFVF